MKPQDDFNFELFLSHLREVDVPKEVRNISLHVVPLGGGEATMISRIYWYIIGNIIKDMKAIDMEPALVMRTLDTIIPDELTSILGNLYQRISDSCHQSPAIMAKAMRAKYDEAYLDE